MGKTYLQARQALADWIGANTVRLSDSVRGDIVNMARRELSRLHDLRFNEVLASTRGYDVPSGWSRPYELWYLHPDNDSRVVLDYLDRQAFSRNFPDATDTGKPTAYTVWAGQILLGKTPDSVITINLDYFEILADLTTDGEHDDLMDQAWEAVHFKGLVLASEYLVEDPRIAIWQQQAQRFETDLVIEHARSRSVGRRAESQEP
jgi:hypothetical protein